MLLQKKKKPNFIESVIRRSTVISVADRKEGLDFLVSFFSCIRPGRKKGEDNPVQNIELMTRRLTEHPILLTNLQHAILSQLINTDLSGALTESGIPLSRGFWQELFGRLRHKLLPVMQSENDFLYALNHIFFRKTDYQWVEDIPFDRWVVFFESIGLSFHVDDKRLQQQFLQSLKILAFQVAQLGLEKEVSGYLPPEDQENNPFVNQIYLIHELEENLLSSGSNAGTPAIGESIQEVIAACERCIQYARSNHTVRGASLHQTYTLLILGNKLERMQILVNILEQDGQFDTGKFVDFFKMLVRNENRKNSIREFLSQCLGYIAYQIAEHKGSKGSKYITSGWPEYRKMVGSAMGGGAIICFVVLIKNILTKLTMPIFWHGFLYSVNYSLGFIAIEETHSTLATKQPAFTASAVAESLDARKNADHPNLYNLAVTVAKVFRSQFASFVGNLVIVFPGTYLLAWLYEIIFGSRLVEGDAARAMLEAQHPWHSLSLLYACNTGFFLFLSGIIAGYVQNKIQYSLIAERFVNHPLLQLSQSPARLKRMARYIEGHAGSLIGNVALGFFLGMSSVVSHIFGIPFDIRHITVSAGNVGMAVYGLGFQQIQPGYLAIVFLGVLGIGFFNFLVSFALAFVVAVKSRGVRLKDYPEFMGILGRYFFRRPLNFIRPPRMESPETA